MANIYTIYADHKDNINAHHGVCSKHLHEWKWNGFYCMSGQLKIRVWQKDYDNKIVRLDKNKKK